MESFFDKIGGESAVNAIVDEFYRIMATDQNARECLETHKNSDLKVSAEKLKAFLSGWLGGPPVYLEKYGHPRLRMRHFPFSISEKESRQWLYCMDKALDAKTGLSEADKDRLMTAFENVTRLIKNRD